MQGTKFLDMLSSIVENCSAPDTIFQKIGDLAGMHHRLGVRAEMMDPMKMVLLTVLRAASGEYTPRRMYLV